MADDVASPRIRCRPRTNSTLGLQRMLEQAIEEIARGKINRCLRSY